MIFKLLRPVFNIYGNNFWYINHQTSISDEVVYPDCF